MQPVDLPSLIDDRPEEGIFRLHRAIFSDAEVFELEMAHLFEGGWVFLGVAAQLPEPHDYFTTTVGRQPVLVMRDGEGEIGAFFNTCPHRGARIASRRQGNCKLHVCGYHSWCFDSSGRNRGIKNKAEGGYTAAFLGENHDLVRIPRFGDYRGLLFGSLTADVRSLDEHLGEARKMLDLTLDQGDDGIEIIPGNVSFTYEANWKLQLENCSDTYHFSSVHSSYLKIAEARAQRAPDKESEGTEGVWERAKSVGDHERVKALAGSFMFANGHVVVWAPSPITQGHPLFGRREQILEKFGAAHRDWMFYSRNLTLFPNVQFADNVANQIRVLRPISPARTEMTTYCIAPKGELAQARRQRLRQYEDFFNPTGMAIPDDNTLYEECQDGYQVRRSPWLQGYSRGMTQTCQGGNRFGDMIDLAPAQSTLGPSQLCDETMLQNYYRTWLRRLQKGSAADRAKVSTG
jgi:benzoate/toluate 1,2-dioxygenase alpha subunit